MKIRTGGLRIESVGEGWVLRIAANPLPRSIYRKSASRELARAATGADRGRGVLPGLTQSAMRET